MNFNPVIDAEKDLPVLVLGLGNVLLKDEGIGVHVIEHLSKVDLSDNVEVIDGGTASLDALNLIQDTDKLIIIDAVRYGQRPGTIYRLSNKDLYSGLNSKKLSLHQFSLLEALTIVKKIGNLPREIILIGIEPDQIDWGLEVSEIVKKKISEIIKLITQELPH